MLVIQSEQVPKPHLMAVRQAGWVVKKGAFWILGISTLDGWGVPALRLI
jgi:hypothetical protein